MQQDEQAQPDQFQSDQIQASQEVRLQDTTSVSTPELGAQPISVDSQQDQTDPSAQQDPSSQPEQQQQQSDPAQQTQESSTPAPAETTTGADPAPAVSTPTAVPQPAQDPAPVSFQDFALKAHNDERKLHSSPPLVWDTTLVAYAQAFADKCAFKHSNGDYGENLAAEADGGKDSITLAVSQWNAEISDYDPMNPVASHWTQVVWKSSTSVGCAVTACPAGTIFPAIYGFTNYYVCSYNPPGNYGGLYGENVFKVMV